MEKEAATADLVLVLGTSLSGLNADQCASTPARRSCKGSAMGTIIISPQRTVLDVSATVRIFATADRAMLALATLLRLPLPPGDQLVNGCAIFCKSTRVLVPYDKLGGKSVSVRTWWDLSPGAKMRVSVHNNIAGAKQPCYKDVTSKVEGKVLRRDDISCCYEIEFRGAVMKLGLWWLEAAIRGKLDHLPVVNVGAVEQAA